MTAEKTDHVIRAEDFNAGEGLDLSAIPQPSEVDAAWCLRFLRAIRDVSFATVDADGLPSVHELHLLPYHRLGTDKYVGLGREYTLSHITPPTAAHMQMLKETAERESESLKCHLRVQIGG
jgi:hypothetical protein